MLKLKNKKIRLLALKFQTLQNLLVTFTEKIAKKEFSVTFYGIEVILRSFRGHERFTVIEFLRAQNSSMLLSSKKKIRLPALFKVPKTSELLGNFY